MAGRTSAAERRGEGSAAQLVVATARRPGGVMARSTTPSWSAARAEPGDVEVERGGWAPAWRGHGASWRRRGDQGRLGHGVRERRRCGLVLRRSGARRQGHPAERHGHTQGRWRHCGARGAAVVRRQPAWEQPRHAGSRLQVTGLLGKSRRVQR
jgi:hypothetical protein